MNLQSNIDSYWVVTIQELHKLREGFIKVASRLMYINLFWYKLNMYIDAKTYNNNNNIGFHTNSKIVE